MSVYTIDHHNKLIHKSVSMNDLCRHKMMLEQNHKYSLSPAHITGLAHVKYILCPYCNR